MTTAEADHTDGAHDLACRLRSLAGVAVDLAPTPALAIATDGTIVCVGEVLARLVGCDGEELIGLVWPDALVAARDRDAAAALFDPAGPSVRTGRGRTVAVSLGHGDAVTIEWWSRPVLEGDQVVGFLLSGADVTERQATEAVLRRKSFQLDHAERLARVGTSLVDVRAGIVTYSDEVYRILELDRATHPDPIELVPELAHPADVPEIQAALDALFRHRTPLDLVCRAVLSSGAVKHIRMKGRVILDRAGSVEYVVGALHDVTDQRHTELELRGTIERFEHAQSLADLATWIRDLDTRRLKISDQMIELFEMDRAPLEQDGASFDRVHPADRPEMEAIVSALYEHGVPYDRPARLLMPDGRIKHVRATGKIVSDEHGTPVSAVGAIQDVSREVEAAARLRATAELLQEAESLAQVGSWDHDVRSGELHWSDELFRIYEIEPDVDTDYSEFLAVVHPDDRAKVVAAHDRSVAERTSYDLVHRLLMTDGRLKWVRQRGHSRYDDDGNVVQSLGTVQDITRTHIAELEVRDLNAELERRIEERTEELYEALQSAEAASRAKSAFVASMSHELRTPLNAVMGYAQLMELDSRLPADLHENVSVIRQAGQQLLSLIGDVIDLARVESGRLDLATSWVRVDDVIGGCVAQAHPALLARRLSLTVEHDQGGLEVLGDRLRLTQVLNNLVSNAVKYNRVGGSIEIGSAQVGSTARITVTDTGIGFDPARGDELFEPFNRLGQEMGAAEGTGIGLAISKRLMREMGGELGFDSRPGRGSRFWIELPGRAGAPAADTVDA